MSSNAPQSPFSDDPVSISEQTVLSNIELAFADSQLTGWNTLFQEDDQDMVENDNDAFFFGSSEEMIPFNLQINSAITLHLLQAPSAFNGIGADATGGVLWGAAVCLCKWLKPKMVHNKRVLELGCGGGTASMVASKYGAANVLATDMEVTTLDHADRHAKLNGCKNDNKFDLQLLDWEYPSLHDDDYRADVILASDVIYGMTQVPHLFATIERYLTDEGVAYIATRDGRRGVKEFRQLMTTKFEEIETVVCTNESLDAPKLLQRYEDIGKWSGSHSIHVFRRRKQTIEV